jgi:hypothetical protein
MFCNPPTKGLSIKEETKKVATMKTNFKSILIILAVALTLSSCFNHVFEYGNGIVTEETRSIPEFTSISSGGPYHIYFEYADTPSVLISCESNLIEYIETAVFDGELKIRTPNFVSIRPRKDIEVYVYGPYVEKIHLSGSGLIYSDSINADNLSLSVSGSGKVETAFFGKNLDISISGSGEIDLYAECDYNEIKISGTGKVFLEGYADRSYYAISGSGKFYGYDFPVNECEVKISGSGDLYLNVAEQLTATISGSGNIHYIGNPQISTNISGSGKLYNEN